MPTYRSSTLNGYAILLTFNVTDQNSMLNESTIDWKLQLALDGPHTPNDILIGSVTIAGQTLWTAPSTKFNLTEYNKKRYLGSGSLTVKHNGDGNLGITFAASLKTTDQKATWKMPTVSITGSYQMPKIAPHPNRTYYRSNTGNGYSLLLTLVPETTYPMTGETAMRWKIEIDSTKPLPKDVLIGYLDIAGNRVYEAPDKPLDPALYARKGYLDTGLIRLKHNPNGSLGITFAAAMRTKGQTGTTHIPQLTIRGSYQVPSLPPIPNRPAYKSNTANGYSVTLHLTPSGYDIKKNESKTTWKLVLDEVGGKGFLDHLVGRVVIGGKEVWTAPASALHGRTLIDRRYVAQGVVTLKHNSNGALGITFGVGFRTKTQGEWWSVPLLSIQGTYQMPTIPKIPAKARKPIVVSEHPTTRQIAIDVTVAQPMTPITGYQIRMRNNRERPDWVNYTAPIYNGDRGRLLLTPRTPLAEMEFAGRARTEAGWGDWSDPIEFRGAGSGPFVKVNGVWKPTNAFVKMGENWVPAICWIRENGKWKIAER